MATLANGTDPNAILNACRDVGNNIEKINHNLKQLETLQKRTLHDADSSSSSTANRQLDALSEKIMDLYRELTKRVCIIKSNPNAHTPNNNTQAAVEDTSNNQVFSQALMQSDRQGRARATVSAVQDRHEALVKIEQQVVDLSQLFQDLDALVVQQEVAVMQIEQKGEEVVDNLDRGNDEMDAAVNTARKTRKKKWICLGICVAIVVIILIIVLIYIRGTSKR